MSDEKFRALTEEEKARLRGDFVDAPPPLPAKQPDATYRPMRPLRCSVRAIGADGRIEWSPWADMLVKDTYGSRATFYAAFDAHVALRATHFSIVGEDIGMDFVSEFPDGPNVVMAGDAFHVLWGFDEVVVGKVRK